MWKDLKYKYMSVPVLIVLQHLQDQEEHTKMLSAPHPR